MKGMKRAVERIVLYPGIHLNHFKDTRFKYESFSMNFICSGPLYDLASASLLSAILGCGTANHPTDAEMAGALLDLYSAGIGIRGYSEGETFIQPFSVTSCKDRYLPGKTTVRTQARELLFEYVFSPYTEGGIFKKEYTEQQKRNKLDLLIAEKDNRQLYAIKKCCQMLCAGEPMAAFSERLEKDLKKATPRSVFSFYTSMLESAPVEIFYFGDQSAEELKDFLCAKLLPLFHPKQEITRDQISLPKNMPQRKREYIRGNQSVLCVGFKTPITRNDERYAAFCLVREILCDSPISLLFTNVREKLGLCYYCSPVFFPTKGMYVLSAGIDKKNTEATENAILLEVERMKSGDFSAELLESCKKSLVNVLKELDDNPAQKEDWYLRGILTGDTLSPTELSEKIMKTAAEEVANAARTLTVDSIFLLCAVKEHQKEVLS